MTYHSERFDPSLLPPARTFYERELGQLSRPSRGWARPKAGCPFHQSSSKSSFSVNLDSGGFYCFGCGAKGGDVIDYLKLRHGMDFRTAAAEVGALMEVTPDRVREIERKRKERERQARLKAERLEDERRARLDAREWLHAVESLYLEARDEHDVEAMADLLPRIRQFEELYWNAAGFEVSHECY